MVTVSAETVPVRIAHASSETSDKIQHYSGTHSSCIVREHYTSMEQPTGRDSEKYGGGDVQV